MAEKMMILLGCDCDPDRLQYGGARYDVHRAHQEWRGLIEGVALLQQRLKRIADDTGISPKVVFCLRSDSQMKEIYGSESWSIEQHMSMWKLLEAEGHELAWHPHLWRWSSEWNCWVQFLPSMANVTRRLPRQFQPRWAHPSGDRKPHRQRLARRILRLHLMQADADLRTLSYSKSLEIRSIQASLEPQRFQGCPSLSQAGSSRRWRRRLVTPMH